MAELNDSILKEREETWFKENEKLLQQVQYCTMINKNIVIIIIIIIVTCTVAQQLSVTMYNTIRRLNY